MCKLCMFVISLRCFDVCSDVCFFVVKQKTAYDMRISDWSSDVCSSDLSADALIENFRPGTLEEIGLGPDVMLKRNPRLVIGRISGFGQTGPYREKPGFGTLVEAMSGFASRNGFPDRPPLLPPLALAAMIAGLAGGTAMTVALYHRDLRGGKGQEI